MTDPTMDAEAPQRPVAPLDADAIAAARPKRNVRPDDPRIARIIAITEAMSAAAVAERRALVAELMAGGVSMTALADAVGLHRTRLYAIVKPRSGT